MNRATPSNANGSHDVAVTPTSRMSTYRLYATKNNPQARMTKNNSALRAPTPASRFGRRATPCGIAIGAPAARAASVTQGLLVAALRAAVYGRCNALATLLTAADLG